MRWQRFSELIAPDDQALETLSGIILTMSVLSTLQVASAQSIDTRSLVYAAIGSTIAWGFVDGMMYLVGTLMDRTRAYKVMRGLRSAASVLDFRQQLIAESPEYLVDRLSDHSLDKIQTFLQSEPLEHRPSLNRDDLQTALLLWLVVVSASLPLIMPLVFIHDHVLAFRVTQFISVWIMFAMGYKLGTWLGVKSVKSGLLFAMIGILIAVVCIYLGG
ncbi:hypothetical protein [Thiothrix eikelboomii]|uniref:VIT family protein n=1 Tax=Thiothrix eikelboomii TaxID=92487 RepID=A0A1T4X1I1_9GAMM|nr:hypothetical protein [Thiothrix eikelboomii]SKA82925.1 hypothetical protein SAMN02745130_02330 [Thiothrix eikelboomii]